MKLTKRMISAVLVLALMLALSGLAIAADPAGFTVTIDKTASGHSYAAYQVFTGDLSGNVLSTVQWGTGVDKDALLGALKTDKTTGLDFSACTDAAGVAKVLSDNNTNEAAVKAFAQIVGQHLASTPTAVSSESSASYTISGLAAGYYFIKDAGTVSGDDAYTRYMLQIVKDVEVSPKSSVPSVEKKVKENDKYTEDGGYGAGYNDVADYNIGDTVPFELIGTLPDKYADYTTYKYAFHDTASAGLTIDAGSVKVFAGTTDITASFTITLSGQELTVSCDDLKPITSLEAGSKIVVKYNATLNANAEIGLPGNPNQVYLTFSNNPNQGGEGDTGTTPVDKVIVFTYELDTTKTDEATPAKTLSGAQFILYKGAEGSYSYAQIQNGKVSGWTSVKADATVLTSGDDGVFKVAGLDSGVYYLEETKAPAGYNLLTAPLTLTIEATTANGQSWTDGDPATALTALTLQIGTGDKKSGALDTGIVSATVVNSVGSTLPTTGGIGTKIFTYGGIALMIAAAVVFIAKRKSSRGERE